MSNGTMCCILETCCRPPAPPPLSAPESEWREYGLRLREHAQKRAGALKKALMTEGGMGEEGATKAAAFMVDNGLVRSIGPSTVADLQNALDSGALRPKASAAGES